MEHWTRDGRDIEILLLGACLASRAVASEVFAAMEGSDLGETDVARVFSELKAAMGNGGAGEVTKRWLKSRGAEVNGGKAIDAVLNAMKERARKKRLTVQLAELTAANALGDVERVKEIVERMKQ